MPWTFLNAPRYHPQKMFDCEIRKGRGIKIYGAHAPTTRRANSPPLQHGLVRLRPTSHNVRERVGAWVGSEVEINIFEFAGGFREVRLEPVEGATEANHLLHTHTHTLSLSLSLRVCKKAYLTSYLPANHPAIVQLWPTCAMLWHPALCIIPVLKTRPENLPRLPKIQDKVRVTRRNRQKFQV